MSPRSFHSILHVPVIFCLAISRVAFTSLRLSVDSTHLSFIALLPFSVLPLGQETTGTGTRVEIHTKELVYLKLPATWPAEGLLKPTQSPKMSRQDMKKTRALFLPGRIFSKLD